MHNLRTVFLKEQLPLTASGFLNGLFISRGYLLHRVPGIHEQAGLGSNK